MPERGHARLFVGTPACFERMRVSGQTVFPVDGMKKGPPGMTGRAFDVEGSAYSTAPPRS